MRCHFYPRSPRGERPGTRWRGITPIGFLSTLPARGATVIKRAGLKVVRISIHAPREGSDATSQIQRRGRRDFYPRSPRGERQIYIDGAQYQDPISIHAPREGSDVAGIEVRYLADGISIHAPREGSDPGTGTGCRRVCHFYPRSPRGERPPAGRWTSRTPQFLSTLPARGATARMEFVLSCINISIHAPREGSDTSPPNFSQKIEVFLSTLPARGATLP